MGCVECRIPSESTAGEIVSSVIIYAKNLTDTFRETNVAPTELSVNPENLANSFDQGVEFSTEKNDIPKMNVGKIKEQAAGISDLYKKKISSSDPRLLCDLNKLQNSIMRQIELNPSKLADN